MRLLLILFLAICAALPARAERVALVIGNSAYQNATALPNAATDAADMAARLRDLGFSVFEGIDLSRRDTLALVEEFSQALQPDDLALFFYAGHGVQIGTENYVVPVDASAGDEVTLTEASVKLQAIMRTMELRADRRIVILDACRNNPFVERLASRGEGGVARGLAKVEAGVGSFIAFSTQPGNVALDGSGRNSPFTAALLHHIGADGADIHAIMRRVRADVVAETRSTQVPWENSSLVDEVFLSAASPAPRVGLAKPAETAPRISRPAPITLASRMFDPDRGGSACYLRRYDAAHLARHPDQLVTEIGVGLLPGESGPMAVVNLRLATRPGERATAIAYCDDSGDSLACGMEGDAGAFRLERAKDGALRLAVEPRGMTFESATSEITLHADRGDDRVFLIPPASPEACEDRAPATVDYHYVGGLDPNGDGFLALRGGPSSSSALLAKMPADTLLEVVGQQGSWLQVQLAQSGQFGWAHSKWVKCCVTMTVETAPTPFIAAYSDPAPEPEPQTCEALWYARNLIWANYGYCFETPRAIAAFGNENCTRGLDRAAIALSDADRAEVDRLSGLEAQAGCN